MFMFFSNVWSFGVRSRPQHLRSCDPSYVSLSVPQFLGVAFLAIGLWAWSEKVSLPVPPPPRLLTEAPLQLGGMLRLPERRPSEQCARKWNFHRFFRVVWVVGGGGGWRGGATEGHSLHPNTRWSIMQMVWWPKQQLWDKTGRTSSFKMFFSLKSQTWVTWCGWRGCAGGQETERAGFRKQPLTVGDVGHVSAAVTGRKCVTTPPPPPPVLCGDHMLCPPPLENYVFWLLPRNKKKRKETWLFLFHSPRRTS